MKIVINKTPKTTKTSDKTIEYKCEKNREKGNCFKQYYNP